MTITKTKKIRNLRGSRTHGWGSPKKHRGSGSRGGVGNAGRGKKGQQMMSLLNATKEKGKVGYSHGFKRAFANNYENSINLNVLDKNINKYLEKKIAQKKDDAIEIDVSALGCTKVLGTGKVTRKLIITAKCFSAKAKEKIENFKGSAIVQ